MDCIPLLDQFFKRFMKMYVNMKESVNVSVAYLAHRASFNVRGVIGSNLAAFRLRYCNDIVKHVQFLSKDYLCSKKSNNYDAQKVEVIRELCEVRDGDAFLEGFDGEFISTLIDDLCVN